MGAAGPVAAVEAAPRSRIARISERDTEAFEVLLGQVGENGNIDPLLHKAVGVLGHAELF
jgi:hypothetical protein